MYCADCEYADLWVEFPVKSNVATIECSKHGIAVDTTQPGTRQCIEDDPDVIWRAARQKVSRYNG